MHHCAQGRLGKSRRCRSRKAGGTGGSTASGAGGSAAGGGGAAGGVGGGNSGSGGTTSGPGNGKGSGCSCEVGNARRPPAMLLLTGLLTVMLLRPRKPRVGP